MRNNQQRRFINYKKLKTGQQFKSFSFLNRAHTKYQTKKFNFIMLASSSYVIEEPFFLNFLKIAKKIKRSCFFSKSKNLDCNKTTKPNGIRMGKGKGKIKHKMSLVRKNQPILNLREIDNLSLVALFLKLKGKVSSKLKFKYQRNTF